MFSFSQDGLGTHWQILIDETKVPSDLKDSLGKIINNFEKRFSRFLPNSEVSALVSSRKTGTEVSADLAKMLEFGLLLKKLTQGAFDLNVAGVMSSYGYDANYSFQKKEKKLEKGSFRLGGRTLFIDGVVELDLGALGKGYLVDQITYFLRNKGVNHFLINGGGDIYASTKKDGSPWLAAIEHPTDFSRVVGEVPLANQSLATSSSQKRRVGDFHHLVSAKTSLPVDKVLSVSVLAPMAMVADGAATAIFVGPSEIWQKIADELKVEFLAVFPDLSYKKSPGFPAPY